MFVGMRREEIDEVYSSLARSYEEVLSKAGYTAYEVLPEQLLRFCSPQRVVDLGCGTGISSDLLLARGCSVVGVDVASGMLAEAAKKRSFEDLVLHDLSEPLPFSDSSFDAALLLGVLEFVEDVSSLLQEVARVLVEDGFLAVTVPLPLPAGSSLKHYTLSCVRAKELFVQAGFSVVWSQEFFGYTKLSVGEDVEYAGFVLRKGQ